MHQTGGGMKYVMKYGSNLLFISVSIPKVFLHIVLKWILFNLNEPQPLINFVNIL